MMQADTENVRDGLVAANDVDTSRAYMLTHQINRANANQMIVLNHQA
jgi:16S rRNA C967 or C1407 C5-methylase (RsmB/RsmF family)